MLSAETERRSLLASLYLESAQRHQYWILLFHINIEGDDVCFLRSSYVVLLLCRCIPLCLLLHYRYAYVYHHDSCCVAVYHDDYVHLYVYHYLVRISHNMHLAYTVAMATVRSCKQC
jgi:hypothetical protein